MHSETLLVSMTFADIILPVPIQRLFTYSVPSELLATIAVGSRVVVQFGRKKSYSGVVFALHDNPPAEYETKPIAAVVDATPIVAQRQLRLWEWIAQYYICSLGEVYRASLPSGLKLESETRIYYNTFFEVDDDILPERMDQVLTFVRNKKTCLISDLTAAFSEYNPLPQLRKLLEIEAIIVSEELRDTYKPKTEAHYLLSSELRSEEAVEATLDALEKAPRQLEAFILLMELSGGLTAWLQGAAVGRSHFSADKRIAPAALTELVKKGILLQEKRTISRLGARCQDTQAPHPLSEAQSAAYLTIKEQFKDKNVVLLNGVTSSGKTEIYIHLITECLAQGKQVLYLLPEIALTTQITQRLRRHFGNELVVYHSKFSDAERVEVWNSVLSGEARLVLGVRSSVLLPFSDLGLIIVDEEHENSFKQYDPAPRYNARDVACVLGNLHSASVLLGSATPSIESYQNAQQGRYGYAELTTRYAGIDLPKIELIDMLEARKHKEVVSLFSFRLKNEIDAALARSEQVILFQNRRGFSPYMECHQCAWVPRCQNCDVSLTYHKSTDQLICHYCSFTLPVRLICPACGSPSVLPQGFGTEKIEEEVKTLFPKARVIRMDLDTARSRRAYEQIIGDFEEKKYDILIGTQMISKGLDFDNVSVVGIMNADNMLNMPDFRAHERTFQLIAQVSGRAGRRGKQGKVFIQTRTIDSPVLQAVVSNDYKVNVLRQLSERQLYSYPPFFRLINITLKHKRKEMAEQAAFALAQMLMTVFGKRVLGPQEPPVGRIATLYLRRISLKIERQYQPADVKRVMMQHVNAVLADSQHKGTIVSIDVDPY